MSERSPEGVLTDFSTAFTAQTPLGAVARLSVVPTAEAVEPVAVAAPPPGRLALRPARPRIRWRRALLVAALGVALAVPVVARPFDGAASEEVASTSDARSVGAAPGDLSRSGSAAVAPAAEAATPPFAGVDQVVLSLPASEITRIGYHEASFPNALALMPLGTNVDNQNTTKFSPSGPSDGPEYLVLSSRGRPNPATSAVDIVMPEGIPVASVVDGEVSVVEPYLLYGRHPDTKIEIIPDARPDLRVVLIHVDDVRVAPGDRVEVGRTILAGTANRFPFSSHIDRYAEGTPDPHVHIEVKIPD